MVRAFARRLERRDINLRFGRALDLEDDATLRRYFDIKAGAGEMVWVLEETGMIAGIAHRVVISPLQAEIALIVRSDLRRLGIGEFLLRQMLARSAREGLKTLRASVLRENWTVLRLAAKVGCTAQQTSASAVELIFDVHRQPPPEACELQASPKECSW
jgi:GNAT superfamily N-acetyltransferase